MKNQTLFILCGEAFSGKSTLAKKIADQYEAKIVGRDKIGPNYAESKALRLPNRPQNKDNFLLDSMHRI